MIEHHRNGRQQHMLVDDEGWAALKSGVATVSTLDPGTHLAGLDIYRDKCPCPENVECRTCGGSGRLPSPWSPEDFENEVSRCPGCNGTGRTPPKNVENPMSLPVLEGDPPDEYRPPENVDGPK